MEEVIRVLSLKFSDQVAYLTKIGLLSENNKNDDLVNIDEIALQFEDYYCAYRSFKAIDDNHKVIMELLSAIDKIFERKSLPGNSKFWTIYGLKNDDEWDLIRKLSKKCLSFMDKI
ncbi:hypothetical protein [Novosphingobium album (ex Liu et al. 2023)]|uniref:CdiI immunity protein domain-containing protein n=1 Tax=Novosphingobium album (ex Liu et al. 2023) TaxID=3031130 RepID=A0ABT5WKB4_9SPHN|nr:hypothetical protein [Novosphingobium album (ex Liu et al. 2023)]MDE8650492.1 hypothetical protein [Novosphingobium album (ex Liu et al. 2023)]